MTAKAKATRFGSHFSVRTQGRVEKWRAPGRRRFELPEELLTVAEVAPLIRVCKATVYRMVKDGSLPAVHVLNGVRIRRSALADFATLAS